MRAWCPAALLLSLAACAPSTPAMMVPQTSRPSTSASLVEVARVDPPAGHRSLLVAYPRTACSATARTVFLDSDGRFYGAVAPGEATLLTLPVHTRTLLAVSSVEIDAPPRTRLSFHEFDVPALPDALLLEGIRGNARQCSTSGHYASTTRVSKLAIEERLADTEIAWMEPRPREGQAWLEAHRARVDEILGRKRAR